MKAIVHVVEATATGTLSMVCASVNLLADAGFPVHVIYSPRPETPADLQTMFRGSVALHPLPMSGAAAIPAIIALRKLLRQIQPDIIHLHSSFAGFIGRISAIALSRTTRIFYSPHCISMMRQDINLRRYLYAALERAACVTPCTYLACSRSEQEAITRWVGTGSLLLENAVDAIKAAGAAPPCTENQTSGSASTIVTAGGVRPQKDPLLFAEIASRCLQMGIKAQFVWVGDGDPGLVSALREAGVFVTGWKTRSAIYELLASSTLFLSTSRWEGLPVSVIEAMASQTPVLANRCAGNVDVIDHGRTGMLFDDATGATDLIQRIINDEASLSRIAKAALSESRDRFSMHNFGISLFSAYGLPLANSTQAIR